MDFKHIPVLLHECIDGLNIKPDGTYVDCTIGGAGHSSEIASRLSKYGRLVGIDKDENALMASEERLKDAKCKIHLVHDSFSNLKTILENLNITKVDGILADLGVSSHQIDEKERGFSYMQNAPLDMRMDKSQRLNARDIVNTYSEKDLTKILFEYGEESFAKSIARKIVETRKIAPIETTFDLVKIVESAYPSKLLHKGGSVCKKTFQALRIETNNELAPLGEAVEDMISVLKPCGRLCVITFHSLEDRIVKNTFSTHASDCICPKSFPVCVCKHSSDIKLITKKPLTATEEELNSNPRSASAKLRIVEKI